MESIRAQVKFPDKRIVKCIFKPCKPLNEELRGLLQQETVESLLTWSYAAPDSNTLPRPPALAVAHALAGDKGPDVRLSPDPEETSSVSAFEEQHKLQMDAQQTMVVRFDPELDRELVLVPVKVKTGQKSITGGYWGYVVPSSLLNLAATVLHSGRLIVVFDLDETLLMAHTVDSLQARIRRVNASKEAKAAEIQSLGNPGNNTQQLQQLSAEMQLLEAEGALLQQDFEMLDYYRRDLQCRVFCAAHSKTYEPTWERVRTSKGEEVSRPVVRMEIDGRQLMFTRVNPDSKSTSVLVRPRPNWRLLKEYLSGMEDVRQGLPRKQRFDVYICTTAEKEYALEAWRLLDPEGSIFPSDQLVPRRMLCVPHPAKKDLLNVLRWEQIYAQMQQDPKKTPSILVTDESRALKGPNAPPATLSVIVDDRADVWEEASRRDLLQVMPFHPHKEAACDMLGTAAAPQPDYQASRESEVELIRVTNTLRELRSKFYTELDHMVKPDALRLTTLGFSEAMQATPTELLLPITPMNELLSSSQYKPPTALGLTERDDRASDLRLLANDHTMATMQQQQQQQPPPGEVPATAAAGNGGTGAKRPAAANVAAAPVGDPRKRRAAAVAVPAAAPAAHQQQEQKDTAAVKQQEQQQFDFAGGIQGLLASLQGATAGPAQQQQQQQTMTTKAAKTAVTAADADADPRAAKKRKIVDKQQQKPAEVASDTAATATAAAGSPGLNNSIGGPTPTSSGPPSDSLVSPASLVAPVQVSPVTLQHPLAPSAIQNLPGPPVPPGHVLAVLQAAAAGRSPNDLAAYNEMFPASLRAAAGPAELLEVLACLSAQYKYSTDAAASVAAMRTVLGEEKFKIMQKVASILNSDAGAAMFFKPMMDANSGVAAARAQQQQQVQQQMQLPNLLQQQQQPVLVDLRTETVDFRNIGLPQQQQQQQQYPGPPEPSAGGNLVLLPGHPAPPAAAAQPPQRQPLKQQQQQADPYGPIPNPQAAKLDQGIDWGEPTREHMQRLGNDPDCFSYNYSAMCSASRKVKLSEVLAAGGIRSVAQLLGDLAANKRGPRVVYEIYQGDKRPGHVQDLTDRNFSCVLKYWGKEWGIGYGPSKKAAKWEAAEEAAANMYVSGINFERLPPYRGKRPAAAAARDGAGRTGKPAAAQSPPGKSQPRRAQQQQQVRQRQQQQGQGNGLPPPPAAVGVGPDAASGLTAEQELQRLYDRRVKYRFMRNERNKIFMAAALHETKDHASKVLVEEVGEGAKADQAVDHAARKLLARLSAGPPQPPPQQPQQGPSSVGPPQQQQQQVLPPWRSSNLGGPNPALQQQQQQLPSGPGSGNLSPVGGHLGFNQPGPGPQAVMSMQNPNIQVPAAIQGFDAPGFAGGVQYAVQGGAIAHVNPGGFGLPGGPYNHQQQQQQYDVHVPGHAPVGQQQQYGGPPMQGFLQGRMQGR